MGYDLGRLDPECGVTEEMPDQRKRKNALKNGQPVLSHEIRFFTLLPSQGPDTYGLYHAVRQQSQRA